MCGSQVRSRETDTGVTDPERVFKVGETRRGYQSPAWGGGGDVHVKT